ncbi:MAG: hypothetical protein JO312_08910 [Hyphomicrobiales bacterium]|nr:hypothetical protein [Hyphomicrobiales bacterium]
MQDLIQNYVSDLKKLRDAFHNELTVTAEELSKAMGVYARSSEAALASFMEKASARALELEVSATARLSQFCGLPANGSLPDVDDKPLTHAPTNANVFRIAAAAEEAVAGDQHVEGESDHKQPAARLPRVHRDRPLEAVHLQLQEVQVETAHLTKSPAT